MDVLILPFLGFNNKEANPDKIIDLKDSFCNICGQSLSNAHFVLKAKRQIIELPPLLQFTNNFANTLVNVLLVNTFKWLIFHWD